MLLATQTTGPYSVLRGRDLHGPHGLIGRLSVSV